MLHVTVYETFKEIYLIWTYLDTCQTPMLDRFCKSSERLLAAHYFHKKFYHRNLTGS